MKHRLARAAKPALTALALAAAAGIASQAWALGLGRLSVQSALGEALRAEIEVTSLTAEEASSLRLRVAPPESYRAAGVEFNPVLQGASVTLVRTADGRPVLRVASDRPVSEPFVDVILELNWATGRLVREYTLLLDPPRNLAASAAPAPATAPQFSPATPPRPNGAAPAAPAAPTPTPAPTAAAPRPTAGSAAPAAAGQGNTVTVQRGDSLSRVAQRVAQPGVSLDQMLVSLFRRNPDAFGGNNMNRLKAGVVLTVPSADEARAVAAAEARQTIVAQSNDFAAYRQQLATGVAAAAPAAGRTAQGTVTAELKERKAGAAAVPDKLTLSQGAVKPSAPEVQASKEAASRDTATRVAELSRNVEEIKRIQAQTAAVAAGAKASAPAVAVAAAPSPAPAPVVAPPTAVVPPAAPPAVAAAPAPTPAPAPAAAATPAAQASAPGATVAAKLPVPAVPAAAEGSFFDSLMDNPALPYAGGVLALVLVGAGAYRLRGKFSKSSQDSSFLESRAQPDSFFGASGGQRIDTREAGGPASTQSSSVGYSLSQLDAIGDVDPVAEADVYLAYGRDLQAEEILKEAMRATPDRLAVRTKLLEVYAKRRDGKAFELLATQVFALTKGQGEDWAKAQEMGRSIDADNPMYQAGGQPENVVGEGGEIREPLGASTMPHSVLSQSPTTQPPAAPPPSSALDLELDIDNLDELSTPAAAPMEATRPLSTGLSLDGADTEPGKGGASKDGLDFDLGDLDLGSPAPAPARAPAAATDPAPLSGFGDLPSLPEGGDSVFDAVDPLQRKLDLAEEFRQIGDIDGARDLLQEVVAQADGAVKSKAQGMLDRLV